MGWSCAFCPMANTQNILFFAPHIFNQLDRIIQETQFSFLVIFPSSVILIIRPFWNHGGQRWPVEKGPDRPNPVLCIVRIWRYYVSFAKIRIAAQLSGGEGFKARILGYIYLQLGDALAWGPQTAVWWSVVPRCATTVKHFVQTTQQLWKLCNLAIIPGQ